MKPGHREMRDQEERRRVRERQKSFSSALGRCVQTALKLGSPVGETEVAGSITRT